MNLAHRDKSLLAERVPRILSDQNPLLKKCFNFFNRNPCLNLRGIESVPIESIVGKFKVFHPFIIPQMSYGCTTFTLRTEEFETPEFPTLSWVKEE